ncbi:hypothetical protein [Rhizobium sp.]
MRLFETEPAPLVPENEVMLALAWHDGDPIATIATLIGDCAFLRSELDAAEALLSKGYGRGWVPKRARD